MIPERYTEELIFMIEAENPFPRPEYQPLTAWQKFRVWRSEVWWKVHDLIFPGCKESDREY